MKHSSCLRFKETTLWRYNNSLSKLVQVRMGEGARLVTGPGQTVYGVQGDTVKKLPSWVQNMRSEDRNRIW